MGGRRVGPEGYQVMNGVGSIVGDRQFQRGLAVGVGEVGALAELLYQVVEHSVLAGERGQVHRCLAVGRLLRVQAGPGFHQLLQAVDGSCLCRQVYGAPVVLIGVVRVGTGRQQRV